MAKQVRLVDTEQRRQLLIDAATRAAEQYGLANVRKRHVGDESGVSPGVIYQRFDSMGDLMSHVVKKAIQADNVPLIADAIANRHPAVTELEPEQRQRAVQYLSEQ